LAILMPCSRASYSASLFDACRKLIRSTYFSLSPCGHINTTPAPTPSALSEPSKYIVQTLNKCHVFCNAIHSAVKSGRIYDLVAFLFSYVMSRGKFLFPRRRALLLLGCSIYSIEVLH
jgi:hypothetical protein